MQASTARQPEDSELFCKAISDEVVTSLLAAERKPDVEFLQWLVEQRDALAKSCLKVAVSLFTTLSILSLVMFGQTDEFALLGIKIKDHVFFVFAALVLGNLLYVVSTGLFVKGIAYEFLLLDLASRDAFKLGKTASGFLACHAGNIFTFVRLSGLLGRPGGLGRGLIRLTNLYMKYIMVICYGLFYYSILFIFMHRLWQVGVVGQYGVLVPEGVYFWVLGTLNTMTVVTSMVIFLQIPGRPVGWSS